MYTEHGTHDMQGAMQKYSPLVKRLAHHMMAKLPPSVQVEDLIQAGLMGLMDALGRYQQEQGVQFETYATQRIRGAMLDELRRNDWLPRGVRRTQRRIEGAVSKAEQKLGRSPSEGEVAQELGMGLEDYRGLLGEARGAQLVYLEDMGDDERDDGFLGRHAAAADDDPLKALQDERFRAALVKAIERLPEREKLTMSLYYEQDLNFREIAAVLGVTESRVCQIHSQAVARLRAKLKDA
jgi:RNA polymerase sigma factor for flagellar operon FliA